MSMDLSVWSPTRFELPSQLPRAQSWVRYTNEWNFEGEGWMISVLPTDRSDGDEPDDAVLEKVPDASYVAYVTLEPIGADAGYKFLEEVVRTLARVTSGVWVDAYGEPFAHDEGQFE